MQSRISGVQKTKVHLYKDKSLLDRQEFYQWAFGSEKFYQLFGEYKANNYERRLAPSVDRIDSSKGYDLINMEWITAGENGRRGALKRENDE